MKTTIFTLVLLFSSSLQAAIDDAFSATCMVVKRATENVEAAAGTGVIFEETEDTYKILTAGHIPEEIGQVEVYFYYAGKKSHMMKAFCTKINYKECRCNHPVDLIKDIALIELQKSEVKDYEKPKVIPLIDENDKPLKIGQKIVSCGFPTGNKRQTAFIGLVENRDEDWIDIYKDILCGRSGSGIFNKSCTKLHGIVLRTNGFCISAKKIREFLDG